MGWPPHLAEDVRFDHAAAAVVVAALEQAADSVAVTATTRGGGADRVLGGFAGDAADHFRVALQTSLDTSADVERRLRAVADELVDAGARARQDAADLVRRRGDWQAQQDREPMARETARTGGIRP